MREREREQVFFKREGMANLCVKQTLGSECTVLSSGEWSVGVCGVSFPDQPLPHCHQ